MAGPTEVHSLTAPEDRSLKARCGQGPLSEGRPLPPCWAPWLPHSPGITQPSASVFMASSLRVSNLPVLVLTGPVTGLRTHPNPGRPYVILTLMTSAETLFPDKVTASRTVSWDLDISLGGGHHAPHFLAPQSRYKTSLSPPLRCPCFSPFNEKAIGMSPATLSNHLLPPCSNGLTSFLHVSTLRPECSTVL